MTQARVRQIAALLLVVLLAADFFLAGLGPMARLDPATALLYTLSLAGLGLRLFWGRFLTICFCGILAAITVLRLAHLGIGGMPLGFWLQLAGFPLVVALLAGHRMQAFFEGRPSRFNRWAGAAPRLYRLRWLIFAQAVTLELVYGGDLVSPALRLPLLVLGAAALGGLAFQKTWGLLLAVALCLAEAGLVASLTAHALLPVAADAILDLRANFAVAAGLFAVPLVVSLLLLCPYARPIIAHLRRS
jgi:hypothetical protein